MSVVLVAVVAGAVLLAALLGAAIAIRRRRALPAPACAQLPAPGLMADGFAAELGDVVSVAGGELWLENAWLLRERDAVVALYFAREAVLALLPQPSEYCYRLEATEVFVRAEPPTCIEHAGDRYERIRRRPVRVEARGGVEPPFGEAVLAEYEGLGESVLWILVGQGGHRAWIGRRILAAELDRWGPAEAAGAVR
jgi:hypothetical protein